MRVTLVPLLLVLAAIAASTPAVASQQGSERALASQLAADAGAWRDLSRSAEDVFGPLPAIASAPFLGLAILGGSSLLLDSLPPAYQRWPVVERVRMNALVVRARKYASMPVVLVLVVLALLTYLANSGKLQGAFGKAAGAVEAILAGGAYLALALPALQASPALTVPRPPALPVVAAQLGPTVLGSSLLVGSISLAFSLFALVVVRLAIGVLIWLIPVPAIDLFFETSKKVFALGFLVLYFVSPWLALLFSLAIVTLALLLFGWAIRLLGFCWRIVLRPLLGRVVPALRGDGWAKRMALRAGMPASEVAFACPAAALRVRGLKYRQTGALAGSRQALWFVKPGVFRSQRVPLAAGGAAIALHAGLTWTELSAAGDLGGEAQRVALPVHSGPRFEELRRELGARDGGAHGAMSALRLVRRGLGAATAARRSSPPPARTAG